MKRKTQGFTLIELVISMAVLAIMLSLSVTGLLSWQDWSDYQKENEYAQTLFIAAQNQLAEFSADGRILELQKEFSGDDADNPLSQQNGTYTKVGFDLTAQLGKILDGEGNPYSLTKIFPQSEEKTNPKLYQDEIISLRAETGDYEQYLSNPEEFKENDPEAYWVFELLGAYVYDTTILNGTKTGAGGGNGAAICVEITPADGQVFAVLYSDKKDGFVYAGLQGDKKGVVETSALANIANRTELYRRERMVGYYGVDTLSVATKNEMIQPALASIKLYNKETFYATFKLTTKYQQAFTPMLTYVLDLDNTNSVSDRKLTLEIDGTKLKNKENAERISCPVSRYDEEGNAVEIGEFPVLAWVEPDYTIHVVLDAADVQATTFLYATELEDIRSEDKASSTDFAKTYSFFRFGVTADNVYASVTAKGEGYTTSKTISNFGNLNVLKNQKPRHTAFAGQDEEEQDGKTQFEYSLMNARHLFNMRYIEDLSYEKEAGSLEAAELIGGVSFELKDNLDWSAFEQDGHLYDSKGGAVDLSSLNGHLMDGKGNKKETVTVKNCDFPSIAQLRERDSFEGNGKTLSGISVSELSNALFGIYFEPKTGVLHESKPTGLINVNYGEVKNLKLDGVTVYGSEFVGGLCGINAGTTEKLSSLDTKKIGLITGKKNVGGLIGFQMPTSENVVIKELINYVPVKGTEAVGGILGMVRNNFDNLKVAELEGLSIATKNLLNHPDNLNVLIEKCENYGAVEGLNAKDLIGIYSEKTGKEGMPSYGAENLPEDSDRYEARYIGGIVGYCYNDKVENTERLRIEQCISSPQYDGATLTSILSDDASLDAKLNGAYVGGIVGYNYFGQINNCSSKAQKGKEGYLFGYRYVGGIVGMNIGPSSGICGSDTTKQGTNENHVIAYEYAGGITGCNANVKTKDSYGNTIDSKDPDKMEGLLLPASDKNLDVKIDNWVNKGIVIATEGYAGGITGFNAGYIYRCNSVVEATTADKYFSKLHSGDYSGGVAGYNNGVVGNTERNQKTGKKTGKNGALFSTACYVRGRDYVGGIVGYNDVDAVIEDYQISSGYVVGDEGSHFVGGYAGFNASVDLLMDVETKKPRKIYSNPNRVSGTYFVGGNIGGNIINTSGSVSDIESSSGSADQVEDIYAVFRSDNFLGTMKGKAFVGGFVGYNLLISKKDSSKDIQKSTVYLLQKQLIEKFDESDRHTSKSENERLKEKSDIVRDVKKSTGVDFDKASKRIFMTGEDASSTKSAFGTITSDIYVGGVLGYNDPNTELYVANVENDSAVVASKAIEDESEQTNSLKIARTTNYIGDECTYTYSYAGGVVGIVTEKTTLDQCYNGYRGTVTTKGTYTGGLCEINEGNIIRCNVSGFGSGVDDYLGGLCGLNKATGVISQCNYKNKTVSGRNVVGGIAAENFGTIRDIILEKPKMIVAGMPDGTRDGVAGLFAGYNGDTGVISLAEDLKNGTVKSDGRFVGLVAGVNAGTIANLKTTENGIENNLEISGSVEGYYDVGALVGLNVDENEEHEIKNYTNKSTVIALNGNAGGIVGENASVSAILYCVNDAVVSATVGNAGGITSSNNGLIHDCYDYKSVSAPKGMCGGITAINGDTKHTTALIKNCYVQPESKGLLASKVKFSSTLVVGGVTAKNYGVIEDNFLDTITVTNSGTDLHTSIGVIAGDNEISGKIYLAGGSQNIVDCQAIATTNNCNVGGVAGTNAGLICNPEAFAARTADGYGYALIGVKESLIGATYGSLGGVAGFNTGTIAYCQVDADIIGNLGTASTGYGGIAGFSGYSTQKEHETDAKKRGIEDYRAQIIDCTYDGEVHVEGSAGNPANAGGIAGVNGYGSLITECAIGVRDTNLDGEERLATNVTAGNIAMTVASPDKTSYAYIGGIAGRNYGDVRDIDLKAKSTDTDINVICFGGSAGGMVGYVYEGASVTGYVEDDGTEHWLTTPESMYVEMRRGENDYGPGGIIGYSKASGPVSYAKNYAHVVNNVNLNVKTGGLIGTLEQEENPYVEFSHLENYGYVEGLKQVGGIIARTKFCSVRMTDCVNYGEVYASAGSAGGLIARIYDIKDSEAFFTRCDNHGFVHVLGANNVGGILGNFDSSTNINCYFYDCDNTGIVSRDDSEAPMTTVGHILGNGANCVVYMEQCQNYNTGVTANGFVGTSGKVKMKNCLDNSGNKTLSPVLSPFLAGGVSLSGTNNVNNSTLENCYYIDAKSGTNADFIHNAGAYFTFGRSTNYDFFWGGRNLKDTTTVPGTRNPALYLTAPSENVNMQQANNTIFETHVTYDKSKCTGLDAFNVYFWYGSLGNVTTAKTVTYTMTATFRDKNGNVGQTVKAINAIENKFDVDKLVLERPAGLDPEIDYIEIKASASSGNIFYRGFTYTPAGASKEASCTYLAEKSDTAFHLDITTNGTKKTTANGTRVHVVACPEDMLALDYGEFEYIRYDRATADSTLELDFDVSNGENATGMKAFAFYPVNDQTNATAGSANTFYYDYECTFTDQYGKTATVSGLKENDEAAVAYVRQSPNYKKPEIVYVPEGLDKKITHINLSFTNALRASTNQTTFVEAKPSIVNNFYFGGFGWIPVGETQIEEMAVGERPALSTVDYETNGNATRLFCDTDKLGTVDVPYVYSQNNYNNGFMMSNNNPAANVYYEDKDAYEISEAKEDGSDSRIRVYEDLHPKFLSILQEQKTSAQKLATPKPSVVEKEGRYIVTWPAISKAYEYEVKYEIVDATGEVVEDSDIYSQGGGNRTFYLPVKDEWEGCKVVFWVRAVNGYRYTGEDATNIYRYDSEWGTTDDEIKVKVVLPQPIVHLELTAGNKMAAVLENREEYKLEDGSYMDCNVEVYYYKDTKTFETFIIPVQEGFVSKEAIYLTGYNTTSDYTLNAYAKPTEDSVDDYIDSLLYYVRGHFVDNANLLTKQQYVTTNFRGFYGTQADNMTYDVYFTASSCDCFVRSDIVAYDEKVGMELSYSTMLTHVAATSGTAYFTATLSDLPLDWFAEDYEQPIVAREYLESSQYYAVHYGHVVAENIYLNGETAEDNKDILRQMTDPYYLGESEEDFAQMDASIWDDSKDALKDGYTLQVKYDADGNRIYDIYYNASIALATKAASEQNGLLTGTAKYKYYNHCVDYKLYSGIKDEISVHASQKNTGATTTKIAAKRNTNDYQETMLVQNFKDGTQLAEDFPTNTSNLNVKLQEMQPAPIINQDVSEELVDGHRAFTFHFDEFFKDTYCINQGKATSTNAWYGSNNAQYLTVADGSVAPTWEAYLQKTDYLTQTDNTRKRRLLNAYYYTYLHASYRVDLLGTPLDGEEAVIASIDVDSPVKVGEKSASYLYNNKTMINTIYELYDYQAQFIDTNDIWNNYSDFKVRVIHNGSVNSMTTGYNVPDIAKVTAYNASTFILPRYSVYAIHVKMKLNTINNPSVGLHNEGGEFVTDNLLYDVAFGAITNENQLKDLGGYLITATLKEAAKDGEETPTHYYYVTDMDASITDDVIGLDLAQLQEDGIVTEIDTNTSYSKDGNTRTALIDLSDFNTGDVVEISVKAIARSHAENYEDGLDGAANETTILARLAVPDVDKLAVVAEGVNAGMPDYENAAANRKNISTEEDETIENAVDLETYKKGIALQYVLTDDEEDETNYQSESSANLSIAVAVYDEMTEGQDLDKSLVTSKDEPAILDGKTYWNTGAVKTIYAKAEAASFGLISEEDVLKLDLTAFEQYPGEFAGKWLKIAAHATSTTRIDSQWSDQDKADMTLNYRWIHLPKLLLEDVNLQESVNSDAGESQDVIRYYYDGGMHDISSGNAAYEVSVASKTLRFAEDKNVKGYSLKLLGKDVDIMLEDALGGGIKTITPAYNMYLQRHLSDKEDASTFDGTWDVYLSAANEDTDVSKAKEFAKDLEGIATCAMDQNAYYVGNIGNSFDDSKSNATLEFADITATYDVYTLNTQLRYETDEQGGTFLLVLPDLTAVDESNYENKEDYFTTLQVLVSKNLSATATGYVEGNSACFRRASSVVGAVVLWKTAIDVLDAQGVADWNATYMDFTKDKFESGDDPVDNPGQDESGDNTNLPESPEPEDTDTPPVTP